MSKDGEYREILSQSIHPKKVIPKNSFTGTNEQIESENITADDRAGRTK
jgi:hypothetical protein